MLLQVIDIPGESLDCYAVVGYCADAMPVAGSLCLQGFVYCSVDHKWISGNTGVISNHPKKHAKLLSDYHNDPDGTLVYIGNTHHWRSSKVASGDCDTTRDDMSAITLGSLSSSTTPRASTSGNSGQTRLPVYPGCSKGQARQVLINSYCGMAVLDNVAMRTCEKPGYRMHARLLRPNYVPPSRQTAARTIRAMRSHREELVREEIARAASGDLSGVKMISLPAGLHTPYIIGGEVRLRHREQWVSWSADGWTKKGQPDHYIGANAFIIDDSFNLSKRTVCFRRFDHRGLSTNISKALYTMLYEEPGLEGGKAVAAYEAAVVDGAADIQVRSPYLVVV